MKSNIQPAAYTQLPERFFQKLGPTQFPKVQELFWNAPLANDLGLASLLREERLQIFSGQAKDITAVALAYAGHQFGHFAPQLGDGRARLLADVKEPSGVLREVHLKGAGVTAFSRRGDGRATVASILRELLVSEGMHFLGVPTSRTLALYTTGEVVQREEPHPGGILVRLASSHVRVGTFEYFAARRDVEGLKALADFVILRQEPHLQNQLDKYESLFASVVQKQITLIGHWLRLGFIHGVMNTDNTTISGETLDFGPCAFMEAYHEQKVFSSIDHSGRYAYARQPQVLKWNLQSLAYCMALLVNGKEPVLTEFLQQTLEGFDRQLMAVWLKNMGQKVGIEARTQDETLIKEYLQLLQKHEMDFTLGFRYLTRQIKNSSVTSISVWEAFCSQPDVQLWISQWKERLKQEKKSFDEIASQMDEENPLYIPRNHLVERAIQSVYKTGETTFVEKLLKVWKDPYTSQADATEFENPATESEVVTETFCGT